MTDDIGPEKTPEDVLRETAAKDLETAPEPVPDAAGLPEDVPSEPIEDGA
jgi:hypothetical protein